MTKWLIRQQERDDSLERLAYLQIRDEEEPYHASKHRCTNVDGRTSSSVGICCHESRDQAHDSITCHRNSVSSRSVGRRQDFWRVCIQSSVIYVEEKVDHTSECNVLVCGANGSISVLVSCCPFVCTSCDSRKEEYHGYQGTNDHSVATSQIFPVAHETGRNWPEDTNDIRNHIVPPDVICARLAG